MDRLSLSSSPQQFLHEVNFHDSGFAGYRFFGSRLHVGVDLCNYDQSWYSKGEPEIVDCEVVFHSVSGFKISPRFFPEGRIEHPESCSILSADFLRGAEVRMNLNWFNYSTKVNDYFVLSFETERVKMYMCKV